MKFFIITVDTEGDNLWDWKDGAPITTENSAFIPRFQELCERYSFFPTYLTNYEMAMDSRWVTYGKSKQDKGLCEIGMHIHAWNSPPIFELDNLYGGNPYITEYSRDVIQSKVQCLMDILSSRFECCITSNRSGRWATSDDYLKIICDCGIKVDCSFTPGLDLSKIPGRTINGGNNYTNSIPQAFEIIDGLLEVPMTTMKNRKPIDRSLKHNLKTIIKGESLWLRPMFDERKMKFLVDKSLEKNDYVEFMVHSSELMPAGSPYFKDSDAVEQLFRRSEWLFGYVKNKGLIGVTLSNYCSEWRKIHSCR